MDNGLQYYENDHTFENIFAINIMVANTIGLDAVVQCFR